MKKTIFMLTAMLVFGFASAQANKIDPSTAAVPPPGTEPFENATQQINRQQARQAAPSSLLTRPAVSTPSTAITQPIKQPDPLKGASAGFPGQTLAYPEPQKALQPGTAITTEPAGGTNNQINNLPSSNTTNQGRVP